MPIDKAELATELEKNPEIEKVAVEALSKKGFVINDKVKHEEFVSNVRKDAIEKELPKELDKKIAEVHNRYDQDIESTLGVKKDSNEKSYDYLKRAASSKLTELNSKIEGYEKTIREKGDPHGILQKKIEAAEEKAKIAIEERDKKINELTTQNSTALKSITLNNAFSEFSKSFVKTLPPMFDRTKKIILDEILASSVLKDGKLYAGDGSGGVKRDAAFKEIPVEDLFKAEFKDVIDVKREQGGAGSKGGFKGEEVDPSKLTIETIEIGDVKTQGDVVDALLKHGLTKGSPLFREAYQKFALGIVHETVGNKRVQKQIGKALPM
jgi:hypothetical protein